MKNIVPILVFLWVSTIAMAQNNNVVFVFKPFLGDVPMTIGQTVAPIWNGKSINISRAQFYVSEISVLGTDGLWVPLTNTHLLVNGDHPNAEYNTGSWPVSGITKVKMHIGVDPAFNHLDPSSYPAGSPLANQNPTMHWGWTAGYRFVVMEGQVDNDNDGVPETGFAYHCLDDALYTEVEYDCVTSAVGGKISLIIKTDLAGAFLDYSLNENLIQHGSGPENQRMMNNFKSIFSQFAVLSQQETEAFSAQITVSPNPVRDISQITIPSNEQNVTAALIDQFGRLVRAFPVMNGSATIEKADLPSGLYLLNVLQGNTVLGRKKIVF